MLTWLHLPWTPYDVVAAETMFVETHLSSKRVAKLQETAATARRPVISNLEQVKQNAHIGVNANKWNNVVEFCVDRFLYYTHVKEIEWP